jgi:hypothetical protein
MTADAWAAAYTDLAEAWRSIVGARQPRVSVESWGPRYSELIAEQRRLKSEGLWVSGRSDLMHLARVADGELAHSNLVAWLLNPSGRHGFGDRLLRALMTAGWPGAAMPDTDGAVIEREVTRGTRIADIVAYMGETTLVIENKVWSDESPRQCEDLHQLWLDHGPDVRFLLLTLNGHPPRETHSRAAADAWRSLAYPALAGWLRENLPSPPGSVAQRSVEQYIATIRETCRTLRPFTVGIAGGNVSG